MPSKDSIINFIFFPRKSPKSKDSKDHLIDVDKNNSVSCRFFLNDKDYHNILFFHGNGEISKEYDDIADYYKQFKLNLIVADYRGYGLSTGKPTKDNLHLDSIEIFKYVKKYLNNKKYDNGISIMGRSLGSASACHIISKFEDDLTSCIIESGFATEYPLLALANVDPKNIKFTLEDGFENLKKLKNFKKPLLIIHAELDDIVPFSQADLMILESGSDIKDLFKVNAAGHNNVIAIAREHYFIKIRDFIQYNNK